MRNFDLCSYFCSSSRCILYERTGNVDSRFSVGGHLSVGQLTPWLLENLPRRHLPSVCCNVPPYIWIIWKKVLKLRENPCEIEMIWTKKVEPKTGIMINKLASLYRMNLTMFSILMKFHRPNAVDTYRLNREGKVLTLTSLYGRRTPGLMFSMLYNG